MNHKGRWVEATNIKHPFILRRDFRPSLLSIRGRSHVTVPSELDRCCTATEHSKTYPLITAHRIKRRRRPFPLSDNLPLPSQGHYSTLPWHLSQLRTYFYIPQWASGQRCRIVESLWDVERIGYSREVVWAWWACGRPRRAVTSFFSQCKQSPSWFVNGTGSREYNPLIQYLTF